MARHLVAASAHHHPVHGTASMRESRSKRTVQWAVVIAIAFAGTSLPAAATMYKWVDEKGQTIYSDQPPPPSIKSEIVKPPPPPANPNALKEMINAETEMKLREKQRVES